jgi:predicted metal-dependent hydrolase
MKKACQLNLLFSMKIRDIFHTSLLRKVSIDFFIEQISSSSFSIVVKDEKEKYEINDILNSRYHYEKLQYRIVWIDHSSNRAWYSTENFDNSKNILEDFHRRYSEKFKSELRLIVIIEAMLSQWVKNEHKKAKQLIQDVLNKMKAKMKENDRMRSKEDSLTNNFRLTLRNESMFKYD